VIVRVAVQEIIPSESHAEPLIQVADLLVGLGAYSYEKFETYCESKEQNSSQADMFKPLSSQSFSHSDRERCRVLEDFHFACKSHRLGVSLESNQGLRTYIPANPINFWLYVPQHDDDTAPTHIKQSRMAARLGS
jgi:hypothetical protein